MFKDQLETRLAVAFGGRAAEDIIFNRITTGASNDIKQATDIAQKMIRSWGMSEDLGPLSYALGEEHIFLGREIAQQRDYSEATAQKIDSEVTSLIKNAYAKAKTVLLENMDVLHRLSDMLLEKETVMGDELDTLILEMRPGFKFPTKHEPQREADESETSSAAAQPEEPTSPAAKAASEPDQESSPT